MSKKIVSSVKGPVNSAYITREELAGVNQLLAALDDNAAVRNGAIGVDITIGNNSFENIGHIQQVEGLGYVFIAQKPIKL